MGLDDVLRAKGDRFLGILNGLDTDLWDPAADPALAAGYSRENRCGKARCRADVLEAVGMDPDDARPVLGMIGRLDRQKGFDILAAAAPALLKRGFRLIVQGVGTADAPRRRSGSLPRRRRTAVDVAIVERFDRDLARKIYAGVDGFLMPSRFEPCGTGQMIALRYGTPPIVRATGGLRDTVIDVTANPTTGTGFTFEGEAPADLVAACDRFLALHRAAGRAWESLLDRGMAVDFDWRSASAPAYLDMYRRAIELRARVASPLTRSHVPLPTLSDGRVMLRAAEPRDLPAIEAGIHDPDVIRWIGPPEGSAHDVLVQNEERWAQGSPTLSICELDGTCVGKVWLQSSARRTGRAGFRWLLAADAGRSRTRPRRADARSACCDERWAVRRASRIPNVRSSAPVGQRAIAARCGASGCRRVSPVAGISPDGRQTRDPGPLTAAST